MLRAQRGLSPSRERSWTPTPSWGSEQGASPTGWNGAHEALWVAGRSWLVPEEDGKSKVGSHPHRAICSRRSQIEGPVPGGAHVGKAGKPSGLGAEGWGGGWGRPWGWGTPERCGPG